MHLTPYVAYLRVFEPLEVFPEKAQRLWVEKLGDESSRSTLREEQRFTLFQTISGTSPITTSHGFHFMNIDGKIFISPWSISNRISFALENLKSSLPDYLMQFFIPRELEQGLSLKSIQFDSTISHVLSETWIIPPRWFAAFDSNERIIGKDIDGLFVKAQTRVSVAAERLVKAHKIVKQAFGSGPVESELVELLNWFNVFDPRSIVELDYGGLANFMDLSLKETGEVGIAADTSIEDVQQSLAGLMAGDGSMAGSGYSRIASRWRRVAAYEQAT